MAEEKEFMTDKKFTFCDKGSLKVIVRTKGHGSWKSNDEMFLNANDHVVGNNILCYGYCKCLGGICRPHIPKYGPNPQIDKNINDLCNELGSINH